MRLCWFGAVSRFITINQSIPAAAGPAFFSRQYFRVTLYYYVHATLPVRNGRFVRTTCPCIAPLVLYCNWTPPRLVLLLFTGKLADHAQRQRFHILYNKHMRDDEDRTSAGDP